jgi:hypothetical protein
MNFTFIFAIILSQLLIFCLPWQHLSACSSSHHKAACPFNLVMALRSQARLLTGSFLLPRPEEL